MLGHSDDFGARFLDFGDMLQHFDAEHAIEGIVGKLELCNVSGDCDHAGIRKGWFFEIQRGHSCEIFREKP